jgi:hypothetical protein
MFESCGGVDGEGGACGMSQARVLCDVVHAVCHMRSVDALAILALNTVGYVFSAFFLLIMFSHVLDYRCTFMIPNAIPLVHGMNACK